MIGKPKLLLYAGVVVKMGKHIFLKKIMIPHVQSHEPQKISNFKFIESENLPRDSS